MRTIRLVAGAVFRESVRDRVPYSMVAFAVLLIAASYLISQLTAGQDLKIIKDLGLAAVSVFGMLIAVFLGVIVALYVASLTSNSARRLARSARTVEPADTISHARVATSLSPK